MKVEGVTGFAEVSHGQHVAGKLEVLHILEQLFVKLFNFHSFKID